MENMYNLNVERAVLSAVFFDPASYEDEQMGTLLRPHDFYLPFHQYVWEAIGELHREGKPLDEEFVRASLHKTKRFDEVAMIDILSSNPLSSVKPYIQELIDKAQKRGLVTIATTMKKEVIEDDGAVLDIIETTMRRLESVAESGVVTISRKSMAYAVESEPEFICKEWLPFPRGTTSMVVAPGGTGKTWFALQMAIRAAREDAGRKVFLWLSEDPEGIVKSRYDAIKEKVLVGANGTEDTQVTISTEDPILLLEGKGRTVTLSSKFYAMRRELREFDVIVIDPLLAFFGGDENDNSQARVFMQPFLNWARSENKTIIFLHHSRKGDANGGSRARGAGAIVDAVRCVYDMDFIHIKKSDGREKDNQRLHMRDFVLTKDNYGAARHLDSFKVSREITPRQSARAFEVTYEMSETHGMPTI